ncbi:MAG: carbohydrate porin [Terrimicrobiaceae bacterium]
MNARKFLVLSILITISRLPAGEKVDPVRAWWQGEGATGKWFGAREVVEDHGLTLGGKWLGTVYGVVDGGLEQRATFDEELKIEARLDFAALTGWRLLDGLTAQGAVRLRDGTNVNNFVGASPAFNPSSYQSGKQWRLMPFYLSYTTPELFGRKKFLTISAGWQNPYEFFARQEDAKFFRNNVIVSGKGISSNGVGWSSSYSAWGGTLKIVPCDWSYVQGGLYMAVPGDADSANHGLDLAGARPASRNGIFALGEAGLTPKIAGLPGKYAFGGYYWGLPNASFGGGANDGKFGLYWMAEQTLFAETTSRETGTSKESHQGLRTLAFVNYAPEANNALPFFFYSGLIYEGLIPTRDRDQVGVAFACGNYSYEQILADRSSGMGIVKTNEAVVEFDYRVQVNRWSFVQPFAQYVIRPGGNGQVANATVLGLHFGVVF